MARVGKLLKQAQKMQRKWSKSEELAQKEMMFPAEEEL